MKEDREFKITEFDYENYLDPELLKNVDTKTESFKDFIRLLNFTSKTRYELLQEQKQSFKELMPHLRGLTEEEQRAFIHKLQNDARKNAAPGEENMEQLYTSMINRSLEKELAKVSEEENYNLKNRYRLNKK